MKRQLSTFGEIAAAGVLFTGAILAQGPVIILTNPQARTSGAPSGFTLNLTGTNFCVDGVGALPIPNDSITFSGTPNTATTPNTTSSSATITPAEVPAVASPTNIPVTISTTAACGSLTSAPVNFLINPPLAVIPPSLPGGAVASPYAQTISASGGTLPYGVPGFSTAPNPPPFTSAPGTFNINFTPTPTQAGTYSFALNFTDSGGGSTLSPAYIFTVRQPNSIGASAGNNQAATVATTFAAALQAVVLDPTGLPVQGAQVTFNAPSSGASGTFPGNLISVNVFTDVNGHATSPLFTANAIAGNYIVTASVPTGVNAPISANFNLTNNPGLPASITATQTPQPTTVNTSFFLPLQATVQDAFHNGVSGVSVTFAAPGSGASGTFANSPTVVTGAGGVATAPVFTANTKAGTYTVTATAAVGTANFTLMNKPDLNSLVLNATAGTPQSTPVTTNFPVNLQATMTDGFGNPISGFQIRFSVPLVNGLPVASGRWSGATSTTVVLNAAGQANAPVFTANGLPGSYQVTALSPSFDSSPTTTFILTNIGPPVTITATAGTPQQATINNSYAANFQATVLDAFSNPVPGVTVTFAAPGSGASGTFSGSASVATNSSGVATAPNFTANSTAGSYNVTASVTGVGSPALFSLTNNPGAPASVLAVSGTPQAALIKTTYAVAFSAQVRDSGGNGVPNIQVTFTAPSSGASGTFASAALVNTGANGVATAPAFTANSRAGAYVVAATVNGVVTPGNFALTNTPGPPAVVSATGGTPQTAVINGQFTTALQATVTDAFGNPVPNVVVTFTVPNPAPPGPAQGPGAVFPTNQGYSATVVATTDASGAATAPFLAVANYVAGTFNATATVAGIATPALFALSSSVPVPGSGPAPPPPSVSITTAELPPGTAGTPYGAGVAATNGTPPYTFSIIGGSLPAGLTFSSGGGISGTPQSPGTASVTVQVTDASGSNASRGFTITIAPALVITTSSPLLNAVVGQNYSVTFQATGGQPAYTWSASGGGPGISDDTKNHLAAGLPPGLGFTSGPATATLSGTPTTPGSYTFTVSVSDSQQRTAFKSFSLTEAASGSPTTPGGNGPPGIQISQSDLNFDGPQSGDPPPPQYISVVSTNQQPLIATIQTDSGSPGTPAPPWLTARFVSATTPARLAILTTQSGLGAGSYKGRVLVTYQGQQTLILNISLNVNLTPPKLVVAPGFLRFAAIAGVTGMQEQSLLVSNSGTGGSIGFTASVDADKQWISITPASGSTVVGGAVPVHVDVNPQTLAIGSYLATVHFESPQGGSVDVPVSLFVSPSGPVIGVYPTGTRFDSRASNGLANPHQITILNNGTGTVNWTAELMAGGSAFSLSPASGQSTTTLGSQLQVSANPQGLQPGPVYGLIKISDPNALNSPQYAVALLNVAPASAEPDADLGPSGLYFTATAGGTAPASQKLKVFVSSDTPAAFQSAASSDDGANWLSIDTVNGTASTQNPGQITVSVNPAGLKPGIYTGDVSVSLSSETIRTANITLVVLAAGVSSVSNLKDRAAGCTATKLSVTSTSLVNAFTSPAGWPTPLSVRVTDDCGAPANGAQVVATFSNGDPPLALSMTDPTAAQFSGTWAPSNTAPQMTITVSGLTPGLTTGLTRLTGTIGGNTAPALSANGTVSNLNPTPGAALAPGTVAQVYGGALTPSTAQPGLLPLPTAFNGTSVLIGAYLAPLYYLSDGQLDIEIPTELQANRQYAILVSSGAAFTLPDTLTVTDVSPGLLNFAQHPDFSTVSANSPAKAGETILLYLVGMGATDPSIASGAASPQSPPANVTAPPAVTVNGESASIGFAGLTPGLVGLYQINVQLPADTAPGQASVTVTQNSATSNTVTIPVQ